jgi:hypothetical protein
MCPVVLHPGGEMLYGREPVGLPFIAVSVRQHEVVPQIHWVAGTDANFLEP